MQLKAEQITRTIESKGLSPIYMVSGDEPLQLNEVSDYIRQKAREQGVEERVVFDVIQGFDWKSLIQENATMSLFSSRRLIELRLGTSKPGQEGGKVLIEYAAQESGDNILLITTAKLEKQVQKSKWYQALNKIGMMIQVWPVEVARLPHWIDQRAKKYNKRIDKDAAQLIADNVEGNMLAASQEINKLCLLIDDDQITVDSVISAVTDSARFDVFSAIECAYAGETKRLLRMLDGLRGEGLEPMAIYGALMWDYRRLCTLSHHLSCGVALEKLFTEYRIWGDKRKQAIRAILHRHPRKKLHALLRQANKLDKIIKSADRQIAWNDLVTLLLAFSGHDVIHCN